MKWLFVLMCSAVPLMAQQQVVPDDFDSKQQRLFTKLTQAVSTPCCTNGIPVAFHDSGMANFVRDEIATWIREGRSEKEIRAELEAMKLGPNQDMPLIFTEPDNSWLSWLTWAVAPAALVIGFLAVFLLVLRGRERKTDLSDQELIEAYRDAVLAKAAQP